MFLDRGLADQQRLGDAEVGFPFGHHRKHGLLAGGEAAQDVAWCAASQHSPDHFSVQRAAAGCDPGNGVGERRQVADPLFEQVADSFRPVSDEPHRERGFAVLRQDQDAELGQTVPQFDRGAQAVVFSTGGIWTSTITTSGRDASVRRTNSSASPACATTLSPASEYPGDAFPQEYIVLADRHAQGRRRIGGRHRMSPAFDQLA